MPELLLRRTSSSPTFLVNLPRLGWPGHFLRVHGDKVAAGIREQLLAEMQKEHWAPVALTNAVVRDGVVELWGVLTDERQREALMVLAGNIPGVKAVKDHMVWVDRPGDRGAGISTQLILLNAPP